MRVGVVFPFAGLSSVPCLVAAVDEFCAARFRVDVFVRSQEDANELGATAVHVPTEHRAAFMEDLIPKPAWARPVPYGLFEALAGPVIRGRRKRTMLRSLVARLHQQAPFSWFIGVDPEGLVEAKAWGRELGVPYAYWSLEIMIAGELVSPHLKRLKRREISANQHAAFTIAQDVDRAALLSAENGIMTDSMVLVPNSAAGPARRAKQYFAHKMLGIPADSFVVLCAGTMAPWALTEEIVRAAAAWPDGMVLVMHSRFDTSADCYVKHVVEAADPVRVRFSDRPLSIADYEALLDSADVGLALYRPMEKERYVQGNLATIGLSSGKVSAYLQAGLPIVVNRLEGPAGLVDNYACGQVVDTPKEIGAALSRIAADYDRCSEGALRCFAEELEFDRHFPAVFAQLSRSESTRVAVDQ